MPGSEQPAPYPDSEVDSAWADFESKLANRLRSLNDNEPVILATSTDEEDRLSLPYIWIESFAGETLLRSEVSSNIILSGEVLLTEAQMEVLVRLSFHEPSPDTDPAGAPSPNWFRHDPTSEAPAVAALAVYVLRGIFRLRHPSAVGL